MKILYHPIVDYKAVIEKHGPGMSGDYVVDCLFHGFRKTFGTDCIDHQKNPHMYDDKDYTGLFPHHGFSMFGRIKDQEIDREDIEGKLKAGFFDYVISPIHHTNRNNQVEIDRHIDYIRQFMPASKFAVICSDETPSSNSFLLGTTKCIFFKQELNDGVTGAFPIAYSVPREIFVDKVPEKTIDFAQLIPSLHGCRHKSTYIYTDEEDYYDSYRKSYFGFTCKKGGWDCMRHYEIISQGCVPFFTDIEACPKNTLWNYPKTLCKIVKTMKGLHPNTIHIHLPQQPFLYTTMQNFHTTGHVIDHNIFDEDLYYRLANNFLDYGKRSLTTEANARYILNKMRSV